MQNPSSSSSRGWPLIWAVLLSASVLLQGLVMATRIPIGQPPDELAHISYVRDAISSPAALPDYRAGAILNSSKLNYLNHPPLYYTTLGIAGKIFLLDPVRDYKVFRAISVLFVAAGFLLFLASARNLGVGPLPAAAMLVACCATPMYSYLAGSINNDTLVYLGVALCIYGATRSRLEPGNIDFAAGVALVTGLVVAALTKATGAAFLVFFLFAFSLLRLPRLPTILRDRTLLGCVAIVVAACGAYYSYAWLAYGSLFPKPGSLYALSPPSNPMSVGAYTLTFASAMWDRLPLVMSHASINPYSTVTKWFFYGMFAAPILGWAIARAGARSRGGDAGTLALTDAFMLALAATIVVHVDVTRGGYLQNGLLAGMQPRYYYFALPFVWVPFFAIKPSLGWRTAISGAFAVCACVAFWASVPLTLADHARAEAGKAAANRRDGDASMKLASTQQRGNASIRVTVGSEATGHIDDLSIASGVLRVKGWAFDPRASSPARRVWIFAGDRYLGAVMPDMPRSDVANALSRPAARDSGFRMTINSVPPDVRQCDIGIAAELSDGTLAPLRKSDCPR